jgi:DNA replication protein DnaC
MKATIFTTNCSMKELADKLGDRTFSRICEMTEGLRFEMNNVKDFRMKDFYKR